MTGPLTVAPGSRLTHAGATRYEYDGYGNRILEVTGDEEQHYEWDTEHRLTGYRCRVRGQETVHYRYQYDALGRRILKEDLLTRTARRFFWQGERLLCECDAGRFWPGRLPDNPQLQEALHDTTHRVWLYEDEHDFRPLLMLCGRETNAGVYHYVCDHLGTPLELRDVRGRVVWSAMLRSYGQVHHVDTAGINQPLRFQGQYHDAESGLYYNRHRYYDPGVGRYLSPDPVGLDGGLNQYAYVPDPLSWIDPLGLAGCNAQQRRNISDLRNGKDVTVRSVEEARTLLDNMPDLRPHVDNFPARSGELYSGTKFSDVWKQPAGTYRGDLYNVKNPLSDVVHSSKNPLHDNNPHYNIIFGDGTKSGIIIVP